MFGPNYILVVTFMMVLSYYIEIINSPYESLITKEIKSVYLLIANLLPISMLTENAFIS